MGYVLENQNEWQRLEYQSTLPQYDFKRELKDLVIPPGSTILDAGCGSGVVTRYLGQAHLNSVVYGCDLSHERVNLAKKHASHLSNVRFEIEDLSNLKFKQDMFDVVVCRYVLQHISKELRIQTLRELSRCLKPGGVLCIVDFDGTLYNLYPRNEFLNQSLLLMEEKAPMDLRIGRKIPSMLIESGFESPVWRIDTMEFIGKNRDQEIKLMTERLENATPFLVEFLKGHMNAERFKKEFLETLKNPETVYFYNKFIVEARKPFKS